MQEVKTENWNDHVIRFVYVKDEWQEVAMDVANALDYSDANKMAQRINKKYLSTVKIKLTNRQNGGRSDTREYITLTELGIYEAVTGSKKPQAQEFKDWLYTTVKELRQGMKLEAYEAFKMLDKQKQHEAMDIIKTGVEKPAPKHYIKASQIANKAIAMKYGYPKAIKKDDMTPQQVAEREEILQETAKLIALQDKYKLDFSVSQAIYKQYASNVAHP